MGLVNLEMWLPMGEETSQENADQEEEQAKNLKFPGIRPLQRKGS
jgi:hypothetical protein